MKAQIRVTGAVQGVGYRPFVAELANEYHLNGEVRNSGGIVEILAEGDRSTLEAFVHRLETSSPASSIVCHVSLQIIDEHEPESHNGFSGFHIVKSNKDDGLRVLPVFPPDIGICPDCLKELYSKEDRRYGYPLISCTSCGPRYSILKSLPYDRENITMDVFPMCPECEKDYLHGRRRHAQTISCHDCGPQYYFKSRDHEEIYAEAAIEKTVDIIRAGGVIGLKGVGGYQLICSPYLDDTVHKLREIKGRETKPFAVMFHDLESVGCFCRMNETEKEYLSSSSRPIVLLDRKKEGAVQHAFSKSVCGKSLQIGAFLPNSGIHSMLTKELGPLIVTSGNISGNPMIVSDWEFAELFRELVDGILLNDREILRPLDDSVIQVVEISENIAVPRFIRRSRGYVPLPLFLEEAMPDDSLFISFGGDLKNTFSIGYKDRIIQSQFFGDLDELRVRRLKTSELSAACEIFSTASLKIRKLHIISDMHPGYASVEDAENCFNNLQKMSIVSEIDDDIEKQRSKIQHHHAHIGSVMAEDNLMETLGVAFDGTGYGTDDTIWGSEFLICRGADFERAIHFRSVVLVGQDEAMKNAVQSATAYLYDAGISETVGDLADDRLIRAALAAGVNTHINSGMGRLFDAVSAILGISDYNSYEGECAILLQNAAEQYIEACDEKGIDKTDELLKLPLMDNVYDSRELVRSLWDLKDSRTPGELSYMFHRTIALAVQNALLKLRDETGIGNVSLSGGVFANRLLFSMCVKLLEEKGFVVYYNKFFPSNDGGISAGQIYIDSLRAKSLA